MDGMKAKSRPTTPKIKFYKVTYQDGDVEDMEYKEIKPIIKGSQRYIRNTSRDAYYLKLNHQQEEQLSPKQVTLSATNKIQRALTASCALASNKSLYSALIAGVVYD